MENKKIRVLLFKPGLDGHWRGIVTISHALTEAGMEVIFEGFKDVDSVVEAAIQEDVDVIGYSVHSGAHLDWTRKLVGALDAKGERGNRLLIVGGAIPHADHEVLLQEGADAVYSPGTDTADVIRFIEKNVAKR